MVQKVAGSNLGLGQLSTQHKWIHLSNQRNTRQRKERNGLRLTYALSEI